MDPKHPIERHMSTARADGASVAISVARACGRNMDANGRRFTHEDVGGD
jgi:hypothetical protein